MLRRPFACALVGVVAAFASAASAQAPLSIVQSGWKVQVRKPGLTAWADSGKYGNAESARGAAGGMFRSGLQVRITRYTSVTLRHPTAPIPYPTPTPTPYPAPMPEPTVAFPAPIAWPQAVEVFRKMEAMGDRVAFRFPTDGCYARAHLMAQEMIRLGQHPWKVWSKQNGPEPLYAATKNHPRGYVTWGWHVAPILRVKLSSGKVIWCVFDPSLSTRPNSIGEWQKVQKRPGAFVSPIIEVTPLGRAPVWEGRRTGGGYTVKDTIPPAALDDRAWATMRDYKPYQGKWHPKLDKDAPAWVKAATPAAPTPKFYTGLAGGPKTGLPGLGSLGGTAPAIGPR